MGKKLVLIGGGHAHMVTLSRIDEFCRKGHQVTVVGPSPHHYYSGMGPGMLSRIYSPAQIRFETARTVAARGGSFICDRAERIDAERRQVVLASGTVLDYDVLSCNTGSHVPLTNNFEPGETVVPVKPIENLRKAQQLLLSLSKNFPLEVAVVGGGPSAVEVAGNAMHLIVEDGGYRPSVQIYAGRGLLHRFPARIRHLAIQHLSDMGVDIISDTRVAQIGDGRLTTSDGRSTRADVIFIATGVVPSPLFSDSGLPTGPDGGLLVNQYLQCAGHGRIFGGGDCICFEERPLEKVGVYAVRQNPVLCHNLMAALEDRALKSFEPGGPYLLIFNLGGGRGIFHKAGITFGGRLAFRLKDMIDRRFMRRFQDAARG